MDTPAFNIPTRPQPLPIFKTCVFKTVTSTNTNIHIDIYVPSVPCADDLAPIALFIHGGGWTGSNRSDYSRPLFQCFLDLGFVVASMDYRLIPESSHLEQLEDVKDVEPWLRNELPPILGPERGERKIVVIGASAGAQLALLVVCPILSPPLFLQLTCILQPKLWEQAPSALLILYAPTNMHSLPYSGRGRLSALTIPPASHGLLFEATDYESPPSEKAIANCALDYLSPRVVMSTHVFREEIVTELLLKGLKENGENGSGEPEELKLPERGSVPVDEVDEISESFPPIIDILQLRQSPCFYLVHKCIYSANPLFRSTSCPPLSPPFS